MGAKNSDGITRCEGCNQQQAYQHPMAAPGASLQVTAQLHESLACRLELSHGLIPFLCALFEVTPNSTCYVIGDVEMGARIHRGLGHFRGMFIKDDFQLGNFGGGAVLKPVDERPS